MDSRMSSGNDSFAGSNMFSDSQHFNAYDGLNIYPNGADSNFSDPNWSLNTGDYANQSRGQQAVPSWQQSASHLSAQSAQPGLSGQASPYGRSLNQSASAFNPGTSYNNPGGQQGFPYRQPQYDPALVAQPGNNNGQNYNLSIPHFNSSASNGGTITPQALERDNQQSRYPPSPYNGNGYTSQFGRAPPTNSAPNPPRARPVDNSALAATIPKGASSGMFSIISFEELANITSSERMANFANVGKEPIEFDCSRMALPTYVHRRSRNDIRAAAFASGNTSVLAKIGKKSANAKMSAANNARATLASPQQTKYEEESSSTEDSSDDSAYSDEDDSDSPLPVKRPDNPKGSVEYDTIKALWRSKRKVLAADTIRQSLVDFWELVKTIRDRWKADSQAVADAETKKRLGELPLLQSRVKDQRDMIEAAFKAALKHGHRAIIELLAENVSLLYLCYQFLLDRVKAEDYNGSLARTILETMSQFTTMSKEKIEKTHLSKILPRFQKRGDVKTQYWVKKINTNAETASKDAGDQSILKTADQPPGISTETKNGVTGRRPVPDSVVGVKRAASSGTGDGTAQKKLATGTTKSSTTTNPKTNGTVKKDVAPSETSKPASNTTGVAPSRKTVVAKPSGFFSNLQSASKKPGTSLAEKSAVSGAKPAVAKSTGSNAPVTKPAFSFAETMASLSKPKEEKVTPKTQKELPPETEQQRVKRLRKEQRRKLHVHFKAAEELVEVRYFTHDPEEEIGHDSSQMRDVADVGGEGRMFKQQSQMMDIDDEDDVEEEALREHPALSSIDFSVVDAEERKRNYAPFGGGQLEVDSAERSIREEYERHHLIVFYPDRSQVPANPREPGDPYNGESLGPVKYFGSPGEQYATRARTKRSQRPNAFATTSQNVNQQQSASPSTDIQSILASLRQSAPGQEAQPSAQPGPTAFNLPYFGLQGSSNFAPPTSATPALPPANIDLAAILASLNPGGAAQQNGHSAPGVPVAAALGTPNQQGVSSSGASEADLAQLRAKNPNYKTKVCRFWQEGRCQKGDSCSYLHE